MKLMKLAGLTLAGFLMGPGQLFAANSILSDVFDGSEMRTDPLPGSCGGSDQLAYQDAGEFTVAADGFYFVTDAYNPNFSWSGVDITALIYQGAFDPANPLANLVTPDGIDEIDDAVELMSGVTYRLVVQQWCSNVEGAWAVTFSGAGTVSSAVARPLQAGTEGLFTASDPTTSSSCGDSQYHETGPFQVMSSGTYYYKDVYSIDLEVDACVQIYTAPFDPANPDANRVLPASGFGIMDDDDTIELSAGQDYYMVVQPLTASAAGEYFVILAPPAPFRINKALAGAWFNPQTNGQGMFIDVYDANNLVAVGWYTFDLSRPVDGTAELGEPGHRWLVALGPFDGTDASLAVNLAQGGVFDASSPPIEPETVVGSLDIMWSDCVTATADYSLTTPPVSGQIPLQPLLFDHVELCESVTDVPGVPGLL